MRDEDVVHIQKEDVWVKFNFRQGPPSQIQCSVRDPPSQPPSRPIVCNFNSSQSTALLTLPLALVSESQEAGPPS